MSSAGTASSASATSDSKTARGRGFTAPARSSPAGGQGAAFVVAGRALHPHHGPLVQLVDGARPGVGAGGPDPGDDAVEQVLHARPGRVEVHTRRSDEDTSELQSRQYHVCR